MIGSIGSNAAFISTYTQQTQPAHAAQDPRPGMTGSSADRETQRLYGLLTEQDWAVVSASVGYKSGPDETGYIHPLQPALAVSIAYDRDIGRLSGPLTADYLRADGLAGQPADDLWQLTSAIDFLEGKTSPSDDPPRRRVDVRA